MMAFARHIRRFARALVAYVWECCVAVGSIEFASEMARGDVVAADTLPPGRPERLRPEVSLATVESALAKDIRPVG
jgi:Family of unknown function (DUF6059)